MKAPRTSQEAPDFSLMLGGPIYQAFRRAHLSGPALELLERRILFFPAITWLPLLVLSILSGHLMSGPGISFLSDIETHVRLLITIPVLVGGELLVHQQLQPVLKKFIERRIVRDEDIPKFHLAIERAKKLRDSIPLEIGLLIFAFTLGHWGWQYQVALKAASWYGVPEGIKPPSHASWLLVRVH